MVLKRKSFLYYIRRGTYLSIFILLCLFLTSLAFVLYYAQTGKQIHRADAVIVLGAAAWGDKPSPVFRERINHAITLYQGKTARKIIFTGGTPKPGYATEAEVAAREALRLGVSKEDIFLDTISRDTQTNLINTKKILNNNNLNSVIIVSDPYHMARAAMIARDLDMNFQVSPTPTSRFTSFFTKTKFILYESVLLLGYKVFTVGNHILY